jgi:hypothetical protein
MSGCCAWTRERRRDQKLAALPSVTAGIGRRRRWQWRTLMSEFDGLAARLAQEQEGNWRGEGGAICSHRGWWNGQGIKGELREGGSYCMGSSSAWLAAGGGRRWCGLSVGPTHQQGRGEKSVLVRVSEAGPWADFCSGPKGSPKVLLYFFLSFFLLFLFCFLISFITFAFDIQIASNQFVKFSKI